MIRSPWGTALGILYAPEARTASPWGRVAVPFPVALGTVASPWGVATATMVEPHRPFGVWDGTAIRWVSIDVPA